jgi:RNAse (barnase) inhibitor barstar
VKKLSDILKHPETSGVYLLEESPSVQLIEKMSREEGVGFFHLEGQEIRNKQQFLKQAALVLRFPEYFGNNWDAFADCLTDMSWHEEDGFVILYDHFDSFAQHSPHEFEKALDIFKESTEFWQDQGKRLLVLLHGKSEKTGDLARLLI